jgi:hypothetical protein
MTFSPSTRVLIARRGTRRFVSYPTGRATRRHALLTWERSLRRMDRVAAALKHLDDLRDRNWQARPEACEGAFCTAADVDANKPCDD